MAPAEKAPKASKPPKVSKAPKTPKAPKAPDTPKAPKGPKAAAAPVTWPDSTRPSLMFLPDKVRGARSRKRANQKAALFALGLLGVAAAGYISVAAGAAGAQADLDGANEVTAGHTRFLEEHAAFQDYYDGFIKQKSEVSGILANDMAYSKVVKALTDANKVGAVFTTISAVQGQEGCPSPDLFSPSMAVGCLEVSGLAPEMTDIATLIAALDASTEFLTDPYLTESTEGDDKASFKLNVGYTDKAFSFTGEKFRPTDEELASITQASAPVAVTAEEPAQ